MMHLYRKLLYSSVCWIFDSWLLARWVIENQKSEMILRLNLTSNQIGTDVMEFGQIMESRGHQSTGKLKMTEFSILS